MGQIESLRGFMDGVVVETNNRQFTHKYSFKSPVTTEYHMRKYLFVAKSVLSDITIIDDGSREVSIRAMLILVDERDCLLGRLDSHVCPITAI